MNNDIKEMIDKIKKCLISGYDLDIINQEELGVLWNYITNLQEENERLKEILHWKQIESNIFYKARIDKAIEILKESGCYDEETKAFCDCVWEELPIILKILTGGDE